MSDEETRGIAEDVSPEDVLGAEDEQTDLEPEESADLQPTGDETDEEPSDIAEETVEPDGEGEGSADAEPESAPELVSHKVSYGGKEFDLQVTPDQAKALDAMYKTALQFPHLQQRYRETLERMDQDSRMAGAQVAPQQGGEGPKWDPDEFVKRMTPAIDDAVQRGAMSEEFKEMYPVEAATGAWLAMQLEQVSQVLNPIVSQMNASAMDNQRSQLKAEIHDSMQKLASEQPDLYGDLNDHNQREKYLDFLIDLDVRVGSLLGEARRGTLERLWPSFQGPELIQAARAASAQAKATQTDKRRNAGGGGGSGGQRSKPKSGLEDIASILGD